MKYVDAALTVILQRCTDSQVIEAICVKIGQYSKRRPKPPHIGRRTTQYCVSLKLNILQRA